MMYASPSAAVAEAVPIGTSHNEVRRESLTAKTLGRKDDSGKRRFSLLPSTGMRDIVDVLMHGAQTYGDWNWLHVQDGRQRYYDALMRHVDAWWTDGEWLDPDSGLPHLAHAATNALFLLTRERPDRSDA